MKFAKGMYVRNIYDNMLGVITEYYWNEAFQLYEIDVFWSEGNESVMWSTELQIEETVNEYYNQ